MLCLTVCEPWATLIAQGRKKVENRTWATKHRGPLLIHAGKAHKHYEAELREAASWPGRYGVPLPAASELTWGGLIAVVDLTACLALRDLDPGDQDEFAWVKEHPFTEGPFCWVLQNARIMPRPVPWRGAQGLWNVPLEKLPADVLALLKS
jgi:hypothetical protein